MNHFCRRMLNSPEKPDSCLGAKKEAAGYNPRRLSSPLPQRWKMLPLDVLAASNPTPLAKWRQDYHRRTTNSPAKTTILRIPKNFCAGVLTMLPITLQ